MKEWELNWSRSRQKLFWFNNKTNVQYKFDEIPDGISISDVGDRCLLWSVTKQCYYWYNFRTHTLEEKAGSIVTSPVYNGWLAEYRDGVDNRVNPYGRRRQHPSFDARPTRHW